MTCREVAEFLDDYLSGTLAADIRTEFDRHLSLCPNCRAYLATYRATVALSRSAFATPDADSDVPPELVSAILKAIQRF